MSASHMFDSPSKVIKKIRVHKLPTGQTRLVTKIANVEGVMVAVTKKGKLYGNQVRNNAFFLMSTGHYSKSTLECLRMLGVISQQDIDLHNKTAAEFEKKNARRWDRKRMQEIADRQGFKLTKHQLKKLGETDGT